MTAFLLTSSAVGAANVVVEETGAPNTLTDTTESIVVGMENKANKEKEDIIVGKKNEVSDSNVVRVFGKENSVTKGKNAEIIGDNNTITNVSYADNGDEKFVVGNEDEDIRIVGSGNQVKASRRQHIFGDNNQILGRDVGTVTDYGHPEGREANVSDLTIGRGNFIRGTSTYRKEWDSLKVIGNNNRADYDIASAGGPEAGIVIGDNQNIDEISESIVIGSLSPAEKAELAGNDPQYDEKYKVGKSSIIIGYHTTNPIGGSIVIGNYSQAESPFQTITGIKSVARGGGENLIRSGTFASSYGAFNVIENDAKDGNDIDGIGNSITGTLNKTSNAVGTMIMGAGNVVTHSTSPSIAGNIPFLGGSLNITEAWLNTAYAAAAYQAEGRNDLSIEDAQYNMKEYMAGSGGAISVLGSSNMADYAIRSQVLGTGNILQGKEGSASAYNTVSGYANRGTNISRSAVVGTGNTLTNGEDNVIIGDYHQLDGGKHNVILGSMAAEEKQVIKTYHAKLMGSDLNYTVNEMVPTKNNTANIENAVMLGYNTDVTKNGGVALGSEAVASTDKGVAGYDPIAGDHANDTTGTWKSTAAAVSIGDTAQKITRQITGVAAGKEDTDAVNVAQLKALDTKVANGAVHYYSAKSSKTDAGTNYANDGATADDSMVIGISSSSEGANSTVLGNNNTLTGVKNGKNNSIVAGQGLTVEGTHNAVFGTDWANYDHKETKVYGEANTVLGVGNLVGYTAEKDPDDSTKWNYTKNSSGSDQNVVVGMQNTSNGGSVVVGTSSVVDSLGTSIGHGNTIIGMDNDGGQRGVAVGNNLTVKGEESVAIGTDSKANADWTIAMGAKAKAEKDMDMAVGYGAKASGGWSMAMGVSSSAEGSKSTALGYGAKSTIDDGVALGSSSVANTASDVAGYDPSTKAASTETESTWRSTLGAVSIGDKTKGYTRQITGVAAGSEDTDAVNVAQLKKAAEAATNGAVTKGFALTDGTTEVKQDLGKAIKLEGENGITVTSDAANKAMKIGLGSDLVVNGKDGKAGTIGVNGADGKSGVGIDGKDGISVKGDKGEVGINGNDGISIKGEAGKDGSIGLSGKDGISLYGKDGKDGKNAAVTISGKDGVDGVNGAEGHIGLNGKDGVTDIWTKPGKPGLDGESVTRVVYKDPKGTDHEVATLDDGMKYGGDMGAGDDAAKKVIAKKLNQQVNVVGGITKAADVSTENNIGVISDGTDNLTLRLAKNLKGLDSVTAGTVVVGKDKDGKNYVTGLDNTTWNGTAVRGRAATEDQLKVVADSVATTVGNGKLTFTGDTGSITKKLGETLPIKGDKNITTAASADGVKISLKKDVDLGTDGSIKAGDTTINKDGITTNTVTATTVKAGGTKVTTDGMTITGGPSITKTNVDMGGQQIHHVKNGSAADDAATVGQVDKKVSESVKSASVTGGTIKDDGTISLNKGDNSTVTLAGKMKDISAKAGTYDITGGKVTIGMQDNYSKADAGNIVINDVAKASDLTKEVSDRKAADKVITNTIGAESPEKLKETFKGTSYIKDSGSLADADKALDKAISSNNGAINNLNGKVDRLGTRVNRVGAGAAALAALHPLDFDPDDKWDVAAGYGNYKDANAVAVGAFYRPNEDTLLSVGGSFGGGENMVNAGVSVKLGQGNHVSTSRVAMAKEIKALTEKVSVLESALAKSNPSSLPDGGKNVLFPDVSENHWAYEYVTGLAKEGILEGYPDGTFGGDRMMTRYEFAAMVYRLMQSGKVGQSSGMDRLVKEFTPELQYIRIDTVSKHKDGTPDIQRVRVIKEAKK